MGIAISTQRRGRGTKKDKNACESRHRYRTHTDTCKRGKLSNRIIDKLPAYWLRWSCIVLFSRGLDESASERRR